MKLEKKTINILMFVLFMFIGVFSLSFYFFKNQTNESNAGYAYMHFYVIGYCKERGKSSYKACYISDGNKSNYYIGENGDKYNPGQSAVKLVSNTCVNEGQEDTWKVKDGDGTKKDVISTYTAGYFIFHDLWYSGDVGVKYKAIAYPSSGFQIDGMGETAGWSNPESVASLPSNPFEGVQSYSDRKEKERYWTAKSNGGQSHKTIKVYFSPMLYTITFNANGGVCNTKTENTTFGDYYNLPTSEPTRTGYTFDGWYNDAGKKITSTTVKNTAGNEILTAKYAPNGYELTADANGGTIPLTDGWNGTGITVTKSVKYDSTYGTLPTPTRTGYTFKGWYTTPTGNTAVNSSTIMKSISGTTIYAQWTANGYELTANANGGTIPSTSGWSGTGTSATKTVLYDSSYGTLPTSTRTGYTFKGWYTTPTGNTAVNSSTIMKSISGTTIYAQWTANSYNIVFDANGGNGSMSSLSMAYDSPKTLTPNTFTRQGCYFVGWSKDKKGVQETIPTSGIYKDGASVNNLVTSGSITLYAVWQDTWTNHATAPKEGNGTSNNPYIIDSAEVLAWMINNHGGALKYYKQTKAINLSGRPWFGIGTETTPFKGVYNGQGYEITNLQIPEITNASGQNIQSNVGLFGYCSGAEITGVYLKNASVNGKENVGLIAGNLSSTKIHSNIIENGRIKAVGKYGAIAGNISGGEIKFNLAYITTNGGTSTNGLYNGSATILTNLIENNGTRAKVGTDNLSGWGKVSNRLLPKEISWGAKVLSATSVDFTNWINKTLN